MFPFAYVDVMYGLELGKYFSLKFKGGFRMNYQGNESDNCWLTTGTFKV